MSRVVLASFDRVPAPKGASQHILANADILATEHDVSLVTLGRKPIPDLRHRPLEIPEPNWLLRALEFNRRVGRVFAENHFDVYHVRSPWEGLAVPAGATMIYEVNGLPSVELPYHFPDLWAHPVLRDKLRRHEALLLDRATLVTTPSAVTAQYLEDLGLTAARIRLVPNAPGVEFVDHVSHQGPPRLCYMGTLTAWQGLAELISALSRVELPTILTILTGAPKPHRRWLQKRLSKRCPMVQATVAEPLAGGRLDKLLASQDLGLAPLIPCDRNLVQGCMPVKILDYMQAGLAVLAPDMPVVRDIVGPDYPLYRRYSRRAMAEQLVELVSSPELRLELAEQGRQRVQQRFSKQSQKRRLLAVYKELQ